eukprot:3412907-Prymnesium_polylepis.1
MARVTVESPLSFGAVPIGHRDTPYWRARAGGGTIGSPSAAVAPSSSSSRVTTHTASVLPSG